MRLLTKVIKLKTFERSRRTAYKIDNAYLSLENEAELRTVKLFNSGSFKGMNILVQMVLILIIFLTQCLKIMHTK